MRAVCLATDCESKSPVLSMTDHPAIIWRNSSVTLIDNVSLAQAAIIKAVLEIFEPLFNRLPIALWPRSQTCCVNFSGDAYLPAGPSSCKSYSAPEVLLSLKDIATASPTPRKLRDCSADVFSAAMLCYEMLAGGEKQAELSASLVSFSCPISV